MPRKFGLSAVVEQQIRLHQEYAKEGRKLGHEELAEFIRLVIKRPDSAVVFFDMGARLAGAERKSPKRWLPRAVRLFLVKRSIQRALEELFGRRLGGFLSGPFTFEVSGSIFVQIDPSGDTCELVTGFCQRALRNAVDSELIVVKQSCETRGDRSCRWTAKG